MLLAPRADRRLDMQVLLDVVDRCVGNETANRAESITQSLLETLTYGGAKYLPGHFGDQLLCVSENHLRHLEVQEPGVGRTVGPTMTFRPVLIASWGPAPVASVFVHGARSVSRGGHGWTQLPERVLRAREVLDSRLLHPLGADLLDE
jgi:hypothetical protein